MELKEYQIKALSQIKQYLELVVKEKESGNAKHASMDAWEKMNLRNYHERKNGLGEDVPNFCLKIPTGGGKTLLAVKTIDLVNTIFRKQKTGLILWVVPTTQIYRQTIKALQDKDHPYRQHLDIASGGHTLILEKIDRFSPIDIQENLVVLMLMLPSASRKTKETLKVFQDNGFTDFFPSDDDREGHEKMLKQFPNLNVFGNEQGFWGKQIKTSLGNTLRILSPVIILDEGHKAYSEIAQETLFGFNPKVIIELSATPAKTSNKLVDIKGIELNREEMIKLDLHVINKTNPNWQNTLLESVNKLNYISEKAKEYEENTGNYIRPICLIQVERTGKDQRGGRFIHSEDAKEYLIKHVGVAPEEIAIKSSEKDDIEGIDLLSRDCKIRFIITKFALQEGWDCPFASVLTLLTNPQSQNSLTQLVGRILRQPYVRKTKIQELDESFCFTFQQKATSLLSQIKIGFENEGLGDLASLISLEGESVEKEEKERETLWREKFNKTAGEILLPVFMINERGAWRPVNYETDIASRIDWNGVNIQEISKLILSEKTKIGIEIKVNLAEKGESVIREEVGRQVNENGLSLDSVFIARQIMEIVPNPWIAFAMGKNAVYALQKEYNRQIILNNLVFIIEELKKILIVKKDDLAHFVFEDLQKSGKLKFMVLGKNLNWKIPKKIKIKTVEKTLTKATREQLQTSLFDYVSEDDFNELEKSVAWYLEDQEKMFFWFRNVERRDYFVQGWRKQKIYPDFIFTKSENEKNNFEKIFVVETKGIHLEGNDDTKYKQRVFDLCNESAKEKNMDEVDLLMQTKKIRFEVIFGDEWERKLNELLS